MGFFKVLLCVLDVAWAGTDTISMKTSHFYKEIIDKSANNNNAISDANQAGVQNKTQTCINKIASIDKKCNYRQNFNVEWPCLLKHDYVHTQ